MFKYFTILMLFILPGSLVAEEEKPKFTEDQLNRLKAAEEKHKDNPELMSLIQRIKEQSGLTEETAETGGEPPAPSQEPALQGDRGIAETAYKNRDYTTAIEHYKALAAEGDAEASLKLGTMYELGKGTDRDPAAAHAWYKKAADDGDNRAKTFLKSIEINSSMSDEDLARAEKNYELINQESGGDSIAGGEGQTDASSDPAPGFSLLPGVMQSQRKSIDYPESRAVKISPEKFNPMQHPSPAVNGNHIQPRKFNRLSPSESISDS